MKFAPGVTFTRLPFGGAVLVNAATLALTECGEPETALIDHLLTHGPPVPTAVPLPGTEIELPPPALLRRMAQQMIESGWLLDDRRS